MEKECSRDTVSNKRIRKVLTQKMASGQRSEGEEGAAMRKVLWVAGTSAELSPLSTASIHFTSMKLLS